MIHIYIQKYFGAPLLVAFALLGGCSDAPAPTAGPSGVRIAIDKGDEDRLLSFYFGGFFLGESRDPVGSGLLQKRENNWFLQDPSEIDGASPILSAFWETVKTKNEITWEDLKSFVGETYYTARSIPQSLEELRALTGDWREGNSWLKIDVSGTMSPYRRQTYARVADLESAIRSMNDLRDPLIYPIGTVFIGEHIEGQAVMETTAMKKRADQFWDYFAYDSTGAITRTIFKEPENLSVPLQCTGCHFGKRLYEPEKSFPALARPGPNGVRKLHLGKELIDVEIVSALQEHARRSDTILGLYGSIYLSRLSVKSSQGTASPEEEATLARLGF